MVRAFAHGAMGPSSDQSFMLVPLSYFSFQPVFYDWCNKGRGMCYIVCELWDNKVASKYYIALNANLKYNNFQV